MANGKEHRDFGLLSGALSSAYTALDEDGKAFLVEMAGGALGGKLGGMMPDIFDPPTSPNHRSLAHGIAPTGAVMAWAVSQLPEWQGRLRERANEHAAAYQRSGDGKDLLMETLFRTLSGFIAGFIGGYASHLVLDARTPRGLPFVA